MATGMINPIFDADQENIKSQLAYADALRKKSLTTDGDMVSGFYVQKNPWQNFLEGLAGGGIESYQRDKQRGIEQDLRNQREAFVSRLPKATQQVERFDPVQQEFGPTEATVQREEAKPARQYADEMRRYGIEAMNIPGMEAVGMNAFQQAMLAPEKEAERKAATEARQFELLMKTEEARRRQQEADDMKQWMFGVTSGQRQQGLNIQQQAADDKRAAAERARGDKIVTAAEKEEGAAQSGLSAMDNVEANLLKVYDPKTGKMTSAAKNATGPWDARIPEVFRFDSTNAAASAIKALQDQMTMINLADAKRSVGQSFGSMQVKEWEKFQNQLRNISANIPDKEMESNLADIYKFVQDKKTWLNEALRQAQAKKAGAYDGGAQQSPAAGGVSPGAKVVSRVKLKDGSTGVLWSDGSRTRE